MTTLTSQTPETDAKIKELDSMPLGTTVEDDLHCFIDHARSLELRLRDAEEHQQVEFHTCAGKDCRNAVCRLRQDRDAQKKRADEAEKRENDCRQIIDTYSRQEDDLMAQKQRADEWKKVAERLADCQEVCSYSQSEMASYRESQAALEQFYNLTKKEQTK